MSDNKKNTVVVGFFTDKDIYRIKLLPLSPVLPVTMITFSSVEKGGEGGRKIHTLFCRQNVIMFGDHDR